MQINTDDVRIKRIDELAPPVGEHKQRPAARVLLEPVANQSVQRVRPRPHVARIERDEDPQTAGEAQHGEDWARALISAASSAACPACCKLACAPPGSETSRPACRDVTEACFGSKQTSTSRGLDCAARFLPRLAVNPCSRSQFQNVLYRTPASCANLLAGSPLR